jgi:hypothetical protein
MARPRKLPEDLQTVRDNCRADVETAQVAHRALRDTVDMALDDVHRLRNMLKDALDDVLGGGEAQSLADVITYQTGRLFTGDGSYDFKAVQNRTAETVTKLSAMRANLNTMLASVDISPADQPVDQEGEEDDGAEDIVQKLKNLAESRVVQ